MAISTMPYKVVAFGMSDVGLVRKNNEDVWATLPDRHFYVLADGMGGHQAGEVAAHEATAALCSIIEKLSSSENEKSLHDMRKTLSLAIQQANSLVYSMSRTSNQLKGMGTTLCCLYFHEKGVVYGHVGDSRIYRLRQNQLKQLSKDHSLFAELVDQGRYSERDASDFLYKNIITRAIGTARQVDPSVNLSDLQEDDIYLMCSDGLSDMLSSKEIENIMNQEMSEENTAKELIATAKAKGGYDNITVIIIKVVEFDENVNEAKNLSR